MLSVHAVRVAILAFLAGLAVPSPAARVTGSFARFFFAVPEQAAWNWNLASTREDELEYQWVVDVKNGRETYQFGFLYFKRPGGQPGVGDLRALLAAGQQSVARVVGREVRVLHEAKVRATAEAGGVAIEVEDTETLKLLFSTRPKRATLRSTIPGERPTIQEVQVKYEE